MTSANPRRFFQFSLATMLVFVAAICVVLAVRVNRQEKRRAAIAKIEKLGGEIIYLSEMNKRQNDLVKSEGGKNVIVPRVGVFARIMRDDPSTNASVVMFGNDGNLTDAELAMLSTLPEIETLLIGDNPVTDAGLMNLASWPNLLFVYITERSQVTDEGIAEFQKIKPKCLVERGTIHP
jgi:hypothetical protein